MHTFDNLIISQVIKSHSITYLPKISLSLSSDNADDLTDEREEHVNTWRINIYCNVFSFIYNIKTVCRIFRNFLKISSIANLS